MTTILFPSPVNTFVIDVAERAIFVGTAASTIFQFNLIQSMGGKYEAVGGDPSHPLTGGDAPQTEFRGHITEVTAMSLSFDGSLLISGDKSGEVFIWDIGSRQVLRKIKGQKGISTRDLTNLDPITSILTFIKPEYISTSRELQQFKRLQNERGRIDHDIWITIPNQETSENIPSDAEIAERGLLSLTNEGSESKLKSRVIELEDELQRAFGAYGELRGLYQKLWSKFADEKKQAE